jgi:myo-inositol 2-dehydrogenase / D-chiro-inositol 1-dehydrogenase
MNHASKAEESRRTSRRNFLKSSALAMTVAPLGAGSASPYVHAAGSDTIRIGLIGCGGRGTGAAINAMTADKGTKLVAMADMIMDRVKKGRASLQQKKSEQVAVDDDHCFSGFDGYKKVIEASDVVLIANAAKFHPLHLKAAIEAGKHVFVEKPHAIDPAGIKAVRETCELAKKKNLCVVSGLQSRHHLGYREAIQRVHDGAIGDIVAIEENFLRAPYVLYERQPGMSEVEYQCSNQYHFHWLSGDDIPQSLVHNVDRASWALHDQAPVKAHGMGGRSTLQAEIYGNVFDHHAVVYEFASGVRMYAFCRTIPKCYNDSSSTLLGSKGRCNVTKARIEGETNWQYEGSNLDPYLIEHQELFKALRAGNVINDGEHMTRSTLIAIMGEITCYSGKEVTWEQISASDFTFPPKAEECRIDMEPPVKPGADGVYPLPFTPGVSQLL